VGQITDKLSYIEGAMVQFNAHFDGNVILPDEQVNIPVNIPLRVMVEPVIESESRQVDWQRLLDLAKECAVDGPADLAEHHDHYAHGKPLE
jgi:hypothetical protein